MLGLADLECVAKSKPIVFNTLLLRDTALPLLLLHQVEDHGCRR